MAYISLTPETEKELIEKTARFIVEHDLETMAKLALETFGFTDFAGLMLFNEVFPFASGLFGATGQEFVELMTLNPRANSRRILERVEELEKEKQKRNQASKDSKTKEKRSISSFMAKVLSRLRGK